MNLTKDQHIRGIKDVKSKLAGKKRENNHELLLIPYEDSLLKDWNEVVTNSSNGTFLHRREYISYHLNRFKDVSVMCYIGSTPVCVFPANTVNNKVFSHAGLSYGGWIFRNTITTSLSEEIVRRTIAYFRCRYYRSVEIRTIPDCFCHVSQDELILLLINTGGKIRQTYIHHCTSLPFRIKNHGKKWGKKKAHRNGLYIKKSIDFEFFWNEILVPNLRKKHAVSPTHSLAEITLLKSRFPDQIHLYGVYRSEQMMGGAVVYETDLCNHLQYVATTMEGRRLACLDLLMTYLIEDYSRNKSFFNMGVSHIPPTGKINSGLVQWKESLGGIPFFAHNIEFLFDQNSAFE